MDHEGASGHPLHRGPGLHQEAPDRRAMERVAITSPRGDHRGLACDFDLDRVLRSQLRQKHAYRVEAAQSKGPAQACGGK